MNRRVALGTLVALAAVGISAHTLDVHAQRSQLLAIQKYRLSNGLPVWIVENHEVAVVQMSRLVLSGTGDDPRGRYGIASLTSAMLTEGAGSRSSSQLAQAIESLGANLVASSGIDSASLQLQVRTARLADALPLMADVVKRPTFPKAELERIRQERLATLQRARDDPDAIAALAISRVIYGPSHRYGTALIGTADTITALTSEDLSTFHNAAYRPANSALIVVGDVVAGEVLPLLETHFGTWQPTGGSAGPAEPMAIPPSGPRRLILVDKPNAPQSRILIGGVGAARSDTDFFAIQVMNAVFLSRFVSRVRLRLPGDTSGIRSGFDVRKLPGPFVAGAAVQTGKTADLLTELFNEVSGMQSEVPADELARAKNEIVLRFATTFEATGRVSSRLQSLESLIVYGLPDDYYSKFTQAIQAVHAVDVQRAAQKYLQEDRLAVVIVGDRQAVEPRIGALHLGSITPMTVDEVFAPTR